MVLPLGVALVTTQHRVKNTLRHVPYEGMQGQDVKGQGVNRHDVKGQHVKGDEKKAAMKRRIASTSNSVQ